jgi:hypothetical protein
MKLAKLTPNKKLMNKSNQSLALVVKIHIFTEPKSNLVTNSLIN